MDSSCALIFAVIGRNTIKHSWIISSVHSFAGLTVKVQSN